MTDRAEGSRPLPRVHPTVDRLAAYSWRAIVITVVALGVLWLLGQLWVVVLALVIAIYLTRALDAPARWLRQRGAPPAITALASMLVLFGIIGLVGWLIVPRVADEFSTLGPTLTEAVDDVETWLVEDSPFDLTRADLADLRAEAGTAVSGALRSSSDSIVSGAVAALEGFLGIILALFATFFFLKDGPKFQQWFLGRLPERRRQASSRMARRAWETLGGYLRGAAILGLVEGVIIAITLALVGAKLAIPVAVLTFAAAFVPIVGAIAAGVIAVLVALATAGFGAALVVAAVALVVQQLDNDLLAPVIYGRALSLHPLIILFAVVIGGALFGIGGTILAVPVTAVAVNVAVEARRGEAESHEPVLDARGPADPSS